MGAKGNELSSYKISCNYIQNTKLITILEPWKQCLLQKILESKLNSDWYGNH